MIKIYHNPRCQKSREGVAYLKTHQQNFEIIEYLKHPISETELKDIISKLGIKPLNLIRTKEAIWKSEFKDKKMTNDELVKAMINNPKLIERPIIINNNKAVIGRPVENISEIL